MLPTLIQRYDKKKHTHTHTKKKKKTHTHTQKKKKKKKKKKETIIFNPVQKRETNWNFTGCQVPHFIIVLIPYINLLNISWIKMPIFEVYGAFKGERLSSFLQPFQDGSSVAVILCSGIGGFICGISSVIICSLFLLLPVPREGCVSWLRISMAYSLIFEPAHYKTNKMACAPSEDSDQPGHPPSLISVVAVRMKKAWVLSYPLSAQRRLWSDWADAQADLSLRWRTCQFVGFVMRWLIFMNSRYTDCVRKSNWLQ